MAGLIRNGVRLSSAHQTKQAEMDGLRAALCLFLVATYTTCKPHESSESSESSEEVANAKAKTPGPILLTTTESDSLEETEVVTEEPKTDPQTALPQC
ncbi:hypothetical protein MHYP_G00263070 [Metynnis hypsauchen]